MIDKEIFSQRLKQQRKKKGYETQEKFHEALKEYCENISIENNEVDCPSLCSIKNWESSKTETIDGKKIFPSIEKLNLLCDFLDCSADYLMGKIEYTTHDNEFISEKTGLTENAIEILMKDKSESDSCDYEYSNYKVISTLIEKEEGKNILDILNKYINEYMFGDVFEGIGLPKHKLKEVYSLYGKSLLPDLTINANKLREKARIEKFEMYKNIIDMDKFKEYKNVIEKAGKDYCEFRIDLIELNDILWEFI